MRAPEVVPIVAESGDDADQRTRTTAASTPLGRLPESRPVPRPSHVRRASFLRYPLTERKFTTLVRTRDESDSSRRWEGTNEGRVKQLSGKPFSLLSGRAEPPALNSGNFMISIFVWSHSHYDILIRPTAHFNAFFISIDW